MTDYWTKACRGPILCHLNETEGWWLKEARRKQIIYHNAFFMCCGLVTPVTPTFLWANDTKQALWKYYERSWILMCIVIILLVEKGNILFFWIIVGPEKDRGLGMMGRRPRSPHPQWIEGRLGWWDISPWLLPHMIDCNIYQMFQQSSAIHSHPRKPPWWPSSCWPSSCWPSSSWHSCTVPGISSASPWSSCFDRW